MQTNTIKKIVIRGIVLAVITAVALAVLARLSINDFKSHVETVASDALGLEVRFNGKIALVFAPFGISAADVRVSSAKGEIISVETLKLGAELMPLLKRQLKIIRCELVNATITIVKDADGKYNFETTGERQGIAVYLNELRMSGGTLTSLDLKTGQTGEWKGLNVVVRDLLIPDTSQNIQKSISFSGSLDCRELLRKTFRIENLKASVRAVQGKYDFEPLAASSLISYHQKAGDVTEWKDIRLAVKDFSLPEDSEVSLKSIVFAGTLECSSIRRKNLAIDNIRSQVKATRGKFDFNPFAVGIFGGKGEGDATADISEDDARYAIRIKVKTFDFDRLQESLGKKKTIGGRGDLNATLTFREQGDRGLLSSMSGHLYVSANNLTMYSMDLDKVLTKYETSQQFNLVDLGAYFIAGPLSTIAIKGYRYGDMYLAMHGGQGTIRTFSSNWKIRNGVANAEDCAFATNHNRVALKGKVNLVRERYEDVVVAILDEKGCAKIRQSMSGPLGDPKIGQVNVLESLVAPVMNLFKKAISIVRGGKCEVFYHGAVSHPR